MNLCRKNILITGSAGFIGFHLARCLSKRGDRVIGLDNFNDYYTPKLKRDRASLLNAEGIDVIEGDICNFSLLKELIERFSITHLVHLAAQAGVRYSLKNPQGYVKANLEGFVNILEICRYCPSIKLTYASSSSVYGLNNKIPFSIDDRTDNQASLYGVTKKTNELMAHTYHHLFGISATGLRFFTVYGPWGRPDMAYFSFTNKIMREESIEIYNHGKMERDFTYIDDIVKGTCSAIDLGAPFEIFNLGNSKAEPLNTLILLIERELGISAKKKFIEMQEGDVISTHADIEYSQKKLDYKPSTSLNTGIKKFIEWYKEYHSTFTSLT